LELQHSSPELEALTWELGDSCSELGTLTTKLDTLTLELQNPGLELGTLGFELGISSCLLEKWSPGLKVSGILLQSLGSS
jgi:hypothetical protein